jgi:hypothetical protein
MGTYEKVRWSWRELSPENGSELIYFELYFFKERMHYALMRLQDSGPARYCNGFK